MSCRYPSVLAAVFLVAGCSSPGREPVAQKPFTPDAWHTSKGTPGGEAAVSDAEAQAQRLMQALEAGGDDPRQASGLPWSDEMIEPGPRRTAVPVTTPMQRPAQLLATAPPPPAAPTAESVDWTTADHPPTPASLTRDQLIAALAQRLRRADDADDDAQRATAAVGLALAAGRSELDPSVLASLPTREQDAAVLLHEAVRRLAAQVESGQTLDPTAVADALRAMGGERPIRIREAKLCRQVSGYGVYEAFDGSTFLAGREQPMIVYVELDDFRSLNRGDGQHEVKLQQEVVLYNAADGLAVWREQPVEMVDHSQNRRRDFFAVRLVKLPPRLNVGKYKLKVRITDLNGGSVDETTLPIDIVADAKLATAERGRR